MTRKEITSTRLPIPRMRRRHWTTMLQPPGLRPIPERVTGAPSRPPGFAGWGVLIWLVVFWGVIAFTQVTSGAVQIIAAATSVLAIAALLLASRARQHPVAIPASADPDAIEAAPVDAESSALHLALMEDLLELQRGVFEVSAELVGCVDEDDARARFAAAMRRWWDADAVDLMLWERGAWRSLGDEAHGAAPTLSVPVQLPLTGEGDLVLDLSPAVSGQAALVLRRARPQPTLDGRNEAEQRYVAEILRGQFALSLRRVVLYGELQALARIDPLTGTHRRWYGEARLAEMVDHGEVVAVAMVDIDWFKKVNDLHGHAAGDQVLAAVGRSLIKTLRTGDLVCRWGGEEFLVILPGTSPAGAELVAERLRAGVAALADLPSAVSVSIGVAPCWQDDSAERLVARADAALYQAKDAGRNRVVVTGEEGVKLRTERVAKRT